MIDSFHGDFRFLSNFAAATVELDGELYATVEHAYQAAKCANLNDREQFRQPITAPKAKNLGRKVSMRPDWDVVKLDIMYNLVKQKFNILYYKEKLLSTGCEKLVEGNYWNDTFWGTCNGIGENHLGKILMKVRSELKVELRKEESNE